MLAIGGSSQDFLFSEANSLEPLFTPRLPAAQPATLFFAAGDNAAPQESTWVVNNFLAWSQNFVAVTAAD
jgi:hypothetical protein